MLINYFGGERCDLNDKVITSAVDTIFQAKPEWVKEIDNSFLSEEMKEKYLDVVEARFKRLSI